MLIENFRPGLMAELGLALDDLRRSTPGLITCSLTAFDDDVPGSAHRPGYDIIVQALSGLMSVTGEPGGEPVKAGVALLDVITGLQAAIGILAALHERASTGRGRHVSVSLFDASVAAMVNQAANHLLGGVVAGRMGTAHPNICPYQAFHAADRPFIVAAGNDRLFQRTCEVVGHAAWADDPRFVTNEERVRHRDELIPLLAEVFATRTADEWIEALESRFRAVRPDPIDGRGVLFTGGCRPGRGRGRSGASHDAPPAPEPDPVRRHGPRHPTASPDPRRPHGRGPGRVVTAIQRWGELLESWAIPSEILAAAPESPYGFPAELFRTRGARRDEPDEPTPTTQRALERLPEGGRVLDVGCGGGATSLPLAGRAGDLVGVDAQEDMLEGFLANAQAAGARAETVHGRWPDVAEAIAPVDVAVAGHVLYNVADLGPFVSASSRPRPGAAWSSSSPSGTPCTG